MANDLPATAEGLAAGAFVDMDGERYYVIHNVDEMPPFFMSIVSSADHWLFVSSTGGLTAGRVSPDAALFPYVTVDRIHESLPHTGPKTLVRVPDHREAAQRPWEPFNREHDGRFHLQRNLYKNLLGNKLCFEEINHDLALAFRYTWRSSERFGLLRACELRNLGGATRPVSLVDGLLNILPAGTPRFTQTNSSNLVDAYKWTELDADTGLALYALYAGITDRPAPSESLQANVAWSVGLDNPLILLSTRQLCAFRRGLALQGERQTRGIRGAFLVHQQFELAGDSSQQWEVVVDGPCSQSEVVARRRALQEREGTRAAMLADVEAGSDRLARIVAGCDGDQAAAEENVVVHHHANTLWNVLRGGCFPRGYEVVRDDFREALHTADRALCVRHEAFLADLPPVLPIGELLARVVARGDRQLERLCREYLPITFGRRHGDPSRPWNQFSIRLRDRHGNPRYWYEGNWRDLFQNWEALALSHPEFVDSMIAKFVNASTLDGYNPYRITKDGIDWEVEDPEDPWSYIGYWGDHQIIYLLKLLELSRRVHPDRLLALLPRPVFASANVPYRIRPLDALLRDPKNTIDFDEALADEIEARLDSLGADARLVPDRNGNVLLVNLFEKLLIPLLAKLGNLVPEGGIWMNTQRPEWNDANNALVGYGLSMVTLCYLRRYVQFLQDLLTQEACADTFTVRAPVLTWLRATAAAMRACRDAAAGTNELTAHRRLELQVALGRAAADYRAQVYAAPDAGSPGTVDVAALDVMLRDTLAVLDHSIARNRRPDGLYHAYNLMRLEGEGALHVESLYPMLEGQVAALSSGALPAGEAVRVVEALFASDIYRPDQRTFMLYPDRHLPGFFERNRIDAQALARIPFLERLHGDGDTSVVLRDADGCWRFNAAFTNADDLEQALQDLTLRYGDTVAEARPAIHALFEAIFRHRAFTGRSGTMFGFEGLGCVYWHMVSKLLLAVQECFMQAALEAHGSDRTALYQLGALYYRVRAGIGFNKSPQEFGAFPMDAYSHTPGHAGARQPGMTGQVKEEILTRCGELGMCVADGVAHFRPYLLRAQEFLVAPKTFRWLGLDGDWHELALQPRMLAFTWCQVPVCYTLVDGSELSLAGHFADGTHRTFPEASLDAPTTASLFRREGHLQRLDLHVGRELLFPATDH